MVAQFVQRLQIKKLMLKQLQRTQLPLELAQQVPVRLTWQWLRRLQRYKLPVLVAVLAVVVNAIRLAVMARSDEIDIMRLVGATATWIRLPFILEGLVIGGVGALITLFVFGILGAGVSALMLNLFRVLPVETSAILAGQVAGSVIVAGLGLGVLGALLSLRGRLN